MANKPLNRIIIKKQFYLTYPNGNGFVSLVSPFSDVEDAVTYAAATTEGLEAIITRNVRDFRLSIIPAIQPEVFLATLS